ncbi:MAG: hypothetical protein JWP38_2633 [Herbaspirillum sp.]|nr:hypothetical protein [Herbaspirillum sp.]
MHAVLSFSPKPQRRRASILSALLGAMTAIAAHAQTPPRMPWPDSYVGRLQAQALIQTLNAELLGSNSATLTLEKWCRDHRLASEPKITATLIRGVDKAATAEQRERLQVGPAEPIKYRRVQLRCGALVLSEADNWYVPARLTAAMNQALEQTDTPFGKAVLPLHPFRRTYAAAVLWSPLPPNWEMATSPAPAGGGHGVLNIPDALFEHRALVFEENLLPIAEVVETYRKDVLAFPPPP